MLVHAQAQPAPDGLPTFAFRPHLTQAAGVDPGLYILSGGKLKNAESAPRKSATLGELFESYRKHFPAGAKEEDTRRTEYIHLDHLARLVGKNVALDAVTTELLQRYIGRRSREKGRRETTSNIDASGFRAAESLPLILEWNHTCEPPWSEKELLHKLQDAYRLRHRYERRI